MKSDALWWMHSMAKREGEEMDVEKMIEQPGRMRERRAARRSLRRARGRGRRRNW